MTLRCCSGERLARDWMRDCSWLGLSGAPLPVPSVPALAA